jgi:hypothetical protein
LQALLGKLETLLVLQQGAPASVQGEHGSDRAGPGTPTAQREAEQVQDVSAAVPEQQPAPDSSPAGQEVEVEEEVEVRFQEGEDGQVCFKLTLSPAKAAAAAAAEHDADPGHMPVSPAAAAGSAGRAPASRRTEGSVPRPGALHDGAARGERAPAVAFRIPCCC